MRGHDYDSALDRMDSIQQTQRAVKHLVVRGRIAPCIPGLFPRCPQDQTAFHATPFKSHFNARPTTDLTKPRFSRTLFSWQIRLVISSVSRLGANPTAAASVWLWMVARLA